MNIWLLSSALLLVLIGAVHSVLGERRIFLPWAMQPPPGVPAVLRRILRASWHLPSLLGLGQAAALAWLGAAPAAERPAPELEQALLASLCSGVLACGLLVLGLTRARHQGGTALLAAAALMLAGLLQGVPR